MTTAEVAARFIAAHVSVIPIRLDGSKIPDTEWNCYRERLATPEELHEWFGIRHPRGVGVVAGKLSGNLEVIDFDDLSLAKPWNELVQVECPGLTKRLVLIVTPRPGLQFWYRCEEPVSGSQKLAQRADPGATPARKTLIETRGEGGYAIAPGSPPAVHANHTPYRIAVGDPASPPLLTAREREILLSCARSLNECVEPEQDRTVKSAYRGRPTGENRPGDDYNARESFEPFLVSRGWTVAMRRGEVAYLRRPGKTLGWSATLGKAAPGVLHVFSSNAAPLEDGCNYDLFRAYAAYEHGGDLPAAAGALAEAGYGAPRVKRESAPPLDEQDAPPEYGSAEAVHVATRAERAAARKMETLTGRNGKHPAGEVFSFERGLTAAQLQQVVFPPLVWPVPGLICEGFTLTSGREKMGKSRLFEEMAVAIATGGRVFGVDEFRAIQGGVLLLALEEEARLVQERLRQWLGNIPWPDNLHIFTEWPRQDAAPSAVETLDAWMIHQPDTSFILGDTLRRVRAVSRGTKNAYTQDTEDVQPFHDFTKRHPGVALVLVHHSNKINAEDDHDTISGSTGLPAVPDRVMVLRRKRGEAVATLSFSGRRGPWRKIRLRDDTLSGSWVYEGEADDNAPREPSPERFAVIQALTGRWLTATELAHELGRTEDRQYHSLKTLLTKMKESGLLVNSGGRWATHGTTET